MVGSPLFRVPSCVFFAQSALNKTVQHPIPASGIDGLFFVGRLAKSQTHWKEASPRITAEKTKWYYSQLSAGKKRSRSALTREKGEALLGANAYGDRFKQGATVVPRSFYFVDIEGDEGGTKQHTRSFRDRVLILRPSLSMLREAKAPWKDHGISGKLEGEFLFTTAVAKNLIPFVLAEPLLVALPIVTEGTKKGERSFELLGHEKLLKRGARFASRWFLEAERTWDKFKTEKANRSAMTYLDRLDFQHGLTEQNPDARFLVLYTGSATDASAVVVNRSEFSAAFIAEHKTYWCEAKSEGEAHYVCAYLNSGYANAKIKDFQSRGLFGPRDIHKTIVKLPFPKYDPKVDAHQRLSALGQKCAARADKLLDSGKNLDLGAHALGRIRTRIREYLEDELSEIDILVEQLSTGKTESAIRASGKGRPRKNRTMPLFD